MASGCRMAFLLWMAVLTVTCVENCSGVSLLTALSSSLLSRRSLAVWSFGPWESSCSQALFVREFRADRAFVAVFSFARRAGNSLCPTFPTPGRSCSAVSADAVPFLVGRCEGIS